MDRRPLLLANRVRFASGDVAADRRADALVLRGKLRREYDRRRRDQDGMQCSRCAKPLARCLAQRDVTNCCYHRGELCVGAGRQAAHWSCCRGAEDTVGCQLGGRHAYLAVHSTFESWFAAWATVTDRAMPRDQVREAAAELAKGGGATGAEVTEGIDRGSHLLPPRVRWVLAQQRMALACCQNHRVGHDSPAFRLPPDLVAQVARELLEPSIEAVNAAVGVLMDDGDDDD